MRPGTLPTALAPMQDVTTLPFMRVIAEQGSPDYFFTEYFRVHAHSRPEAHIVRSLDAIGPHHPIFAQIIGEDIPSIEFTMRELAKHPIAGIDLNLGCPAPKVYKKNVGGGLLRDFARIDALLRSMRAATEGRFTVKTRIGFDDADSFAALIETFAQHDIDLLSIHGRTVAQRYRGEVDYERIAWAKRQLPCPVFANGNISSAAKALEVREQTGVDGVMIGRGAVRNPWIFRQIREASAGQTVYAPTLADARHYVDALWSAFASPELADRPQTNFIKKFLNFVGQAIDPEGQFLKEMRRAESSTELFQICDRWMLAGGRDREPFPEEPYEGVIARPNHEAPLETDGCHL